MQNGYVNENTLVSSPKNNNPWQTCKEQSKKPKSQKITIEIATPQRSKHHNSIQTTSPKRVRFSVIYIVTK